jgi:hypothetical protein
MIKGLINYNLIYFILKKCDSYVYVTYVVLKKLNETFEINVLNLCNIFSYKISKFIIFIEVWN